MNAQVAAYAVAVACLGAGCSTSRQDSFADWMPSAQAAVYSPTAKPGFDSPEGVTRFLEQRWPLENIRAFCIPERRNNGFYQGLVPDEPRTWKGILYPNRRTGFDRISWYATVRGDRLIAYSLGVERGRYYWQLEVRTPESAQEPPRVTPDPSEPWFVGPDRQPTEESLIGDYVHLSQRIHLTLRIDGTYLAGFEEAQGREGSTEGVWKLTGKRLRFSPVSETGQMKGMLRKARVKMEHHHWVIVRSVNRKVFSNPGDEPDAFFRLLEGLEW